MTDIADFPEYHKIDTLFERDAATFVVDTSKLKASVLGTINAWDATEKIDGTNIRVILAESGEVSFGGRSNAAEIPGDLMQYLTRTFTPERLKAVFWIEGKPTEAILFGEGYGLGIQKPGRLYRPDQAFILFDVLVSRKWWLEAPAISDIAPKLAIETVPYVGRMTLDEIVETVRTPFPSKIGTAMAEGIVARPIETLFNRRGERIIIKLKTKDFRAGRR